MSDPAELRDFVYVKYQTSGEGMKIARHVRPALLDPSDELADFVRNIVHTYKSNPDVTYLGLADEDEFEAFRKLRTA